jgi:Tfp pilus assembly protein PilO
MNPNDDFWLLILEFAIAVCGFAASWGASKAHQKQTDKRLDSIEEKYITRSEFISALSDIKEQHRDMKDDIKRILELMTKRGRS